MKVMANSIPKGGTHLVIRLMNLLGYSDSPFWIGADLIRGRGEYIKRIMKGSNSIDTVMIGSEVPVPVGRKWLSRKLNQLSDNSVFGAHCLYSTGFSRLLDEADVSSVCIIRDPRSIAMSHLQYLKKFRRHFFYKYYMTLPSDFHRLSLTVKGGRLGPYMLASLRDRYIDYMRWSDSDRALVIRFEDLVGEKGGGNDSDQQTTISRVVSFLGLDISTSRMQKVKADLFGDSNTFRKGQSNAWETELSDGMIELLSNEITEVLVKLGYETDHDWSDRYVHR